MTTWALLAPGPSSTAEQAARVHEADIPLGSVGCAYQLSPHAAFIAATDSGWWRKYPDAKARDCPKFTMHTVPGCTHVRMPGFGVVNSGVLGLEIAKRRGATRILLLGFDMHGSHFFGPYTNGLSNTADAKRKVHLRQFAQWGKANPKIEIINCTEGSALKCFQEASLGDCIHDSFRAN